MITIKKNKFYATETPYLFLAVRATPKDSNVEERKSKCFYIVEFQDRTPNRNRAYSVEYKVLSTKELRAVLQIEDKKIEVI